MSDPAEQKKRVLAIIKRHIQAKGKLPAGWDNDTYDYRESGAIDSMGIIKFVVELESEFDLTISDEDMLTPGFTTVGGLVSIVLGKIREPAG